MKASQYRHFRVHLLLGWLLAGTALALLTPVSPVSATLGWSGLYWLLAAPTLMLVASVLSGLDHHAAPSRRRSMRRRNSAMMSR